LRYPGSTALVLRKMRDSMVNSTLAFLEETVIGDDPRVRHIERKRRFVFDNGSVLYYGGMKDKQQREQVRSISKTGGIDIIWMEEANSFIEDDYQEAITRMRGTVGAFRQMILTTNPDYPTHWINKRLIIGGEASVYYSYVGDNPYNPEDYIETLYGLTGVYHDRMVKGLWVRGEGLVYDEYDPAIHLVDAFEIPKDWRRFRSVDFGFRNPFVCQWWAMDPEARLYRYREIYWTERTVGDHAAVIKEHTGDEPVEATVCDHDAEDMATLRQNGIRTTPAQKEVATGIKAVMERLRRAKDGYPRLYLLRGSLVQRDPRLEKAKKPTCTEEELVAYRWQTVGDDKEEREIPLKLNDHGCDDLRYMVRHIDKKRKRMRAR